MRAFYDDWRTETRWMDADDGLAFYPVVSSSRFEDTRGNETLCLQHFFRASYRDVLSLLSLYGMAPNH
jgi:hypothetical protein